MAHIRTANSPSTVSLCAWLPGCLALRAVSLAHVQEGVTLSSRSNVKSELPPTALFDRPVAVFASGLFAVV